jgi:hypothetical protein
MDESREAVQRFDKLYEFDRVPVSKDRLLGVGYFAGSFAGEHVAATEFVIGAMFVKWGATVQDIFLGLAIGNVLAVLTWTVTFAGERRPHEPQEESGIPLSLYLSKRR